MAQAVLKEITIKDFGPLEDVHLEFPESGVIALSGPCAAGKTHIVAAIKATCTATMPWANAERETDRTMGEYVRRGATEAYISALYQSGSDLVRVTRIIRLAKDQPLEEMIAAGQAPKASCTHKLVLNDAKPITKEAEVAAAIQSIFGLDNQEQVAAVIVEQDQAGIIWKQKKAGRLKMFQLLSGAEKLMELNSYVTARAEHFKTMDYTDDLLRVELEVRNLEARLKEYEDALAQDDTGDAARISADRIRTKLAEITVLEARHAKKAEAVKEQADLVAKAEALLTEKQKVEAELNSIRAQPNKADPNRKARAEDVVRRYKQAEETRKQIKIVEAEILHISALLGSPEPKALDLVHGELATLQKERAECGIAYTTANSSLKKYGTSGNCPLCGSSGVCPQCGHKTLDLQASVAQWQADEAKYRELLAGLDSQIKLKQVELSQVKQQHDQRAQWQRDLSALESDLKARVASSSNVDEAAHEEALSVIKDEEALEHEDHIRAAAAESRHSKVFEYAREWNSLCGRMEANVKVIEEKLPEVPDEDTVHAWREELEGLEDKVTARATIEGRLESTREAFTTADERRKTLALKVAEAEKTGKAAKFLSELKAASHANALPRLMAGAYVAKLNHHLTAVCSKLKTPFTLFIEPETLGLMLRDEKMVAPAVKYTSRGQFTMAAWAWIMSLYQMHGTGVGFLVLDEPNTGLDDNYRACVSELVSGMGDHFRRRGLQLILISHNVDDVNPDVTLTW